MKCAASQRGFSLLETLAAVAIISVLAAMLFPVVASAKSAAKLTTCLSNLRQVNTSTLLYTSESDDRLPWGVSKISQRTSFPYETNLTESEIAGIPAISDILAIYGPKSESWQCPADVMRSVYAPDTCHGSWFQCYETSYDYNARFALNGRSQSQIKNPTTSLLHYDVDAFHPYLTTNPTQQNVSLQRINGAFMDGHAKSLPFHQLPEILNTDQ
jgi:prepilin-type N-terminal cleavage/methylation domain-containing protein